MAAIMRGEQPASWLGPPPAAERLKKRGLVTSQVERCATCPGPPRCSGSETFSVTQLGLMVWNATKPPL